MTKRIIALLLVLILTVGLLPTVALAADAQPDVQVSKSDDNLNLVKTIKKAGENYTVTLESWATGAVTTETTPMPLDIILVLDESGSMSETFSSKQGKYYEEIKYYRTNQNYYKWSKEKDGIWYKDTDNNYYKVTVQREQVEDFFGWHYKFTYTYSKNGKAMTIGSSERKNTNPGYTFYRQYTGNVNITKREALVEAATNFADSVYKEATKANGPNHRIAVVTYSGDAQIKTGTTVNNALISVKTGLNAIKSAINGLKTDGGTYINEGIQKANNIFEKNPIAEEGKRARVMIVFTDGAPGLNGIWCRDNSQYYDTDTHEIAQAAIKEANTAEQTYKATVYTIGIFQGANVGNPKSLPAYTPDVKVYNNGDYQNDNEKAKATANSNRFMHLVSSNYPNAINMTNTGNYNVKLEEDDNNTYYLAAASASELSDVFTAIISSIKTDTTELNETATIIDNIPGNFTIPTGAQGIKIYTAKCKGKTGETLSWEERQASNLQPTTTTNTTTGVKSVSVTGFDYSDEWCGLDENSAPHGSKLIIEFTIKHDNYGGTQPTNAGASIKDEENKDVITVDNPSVPVTIAKPSITGVTRSKVYDGTGFDVLSTIAEDINALADGKKNAYVDIVVTVTSGSNTYTYTISKGATTGSWDKTGLTTEKDVKIESGAVSSYTYDLSITFKDATANGAAAATKNATATYTITKRPVTLTSASDEKVWDSTALTNDTVTASAGEGNTVGGFVTGEGATYNVTGSQTEVGKSDNTFDYTLNNNTKATNYEITKQLGKLKVTQDDTEITVTIIGKQETKEYNGQTQTVTGFTYTVEGAGHDDVTVTLKENQKAEASGKDVKTVNDGKYSMNLTSDMFDVSSTKYSNVKITTVTDGWLKITPLAVTLTSGSGSKEYDGTALTNSKVEATGAGAERFLQEVNDFKANGSVKGTADMTTAQSVTNNISYTWKDGFSASNYTITTNPGTLTITPIAQLKITFKTELGGKIDGGTEPIEKTVQRNDSFPAVPTTEANNGYYFLGWYDESGNKVEENEFPEKVTGNATYTAKWKKYDSVTLNLTGRFQKELTSDTATLPENANSFTLNIKNDNSQTVAQAHVLNVPLEQKSSKYTGTKAFAVESGSEMTFNAAGTYIYTVAEAAGSISGMSYDDTTYTMTVEVVANEGKLTIQSATIEGGTVGTVNLLAAEGTNSITFHNEYTKPKKSINLGDLIQKDFDKKTGSEDLPTGSSYTFRVRAYERFQKPDGSYCYSDAPYLGEVVMTEFGQKNFVFNYGVITFFEHGTHEYVVEEFNDGAENVEYDSNRYLLVLDVADDLTITARNAGSLNDEVSTQSVEQTPVITFCNKYNKEKDPDKLTINFSDFVQKELTATGTKTANDVDFRVNVNGYKVEINSLIGEEISTYDEPAPDFTTTLGAHFDGITGGETKTTSFNGSIQLDQVGCYSFNLSEEDGQRTGVTYDETRYMLTIYVSFDKEKNELYVSRAYATCYNAGTWGDEINLFDMVNDKPVRNNNYITFHNTIDTGKDNYYPIIIPTIINKDTGMLNKTDHFAYVIGYPDGTVHPNGQITRAEVATIFFRLLRDEVRDGAFTTSNAYSDVAYGKWYNNPISTMSALGIITGYPDGTFKPNKPITRAEFAAIAARFDETQSGKSATFSDVIGHWAAKEIGIAYYNDWIKGYPDGTFKPDQNITRAEAMTLINRVLERKPESPADLLTNMNKWTDNMDTSKWYYLDVQEATNSHGYTRKTFNYELWRQMLPDPDWSRYER